MPNEPDLSALLPPAPPPRPDRREVAIDAAMRRFDGGPEAKSAPGSPGRWRLLGRPQLGVFAAAALVAVIGLPLWLSGEHRAPSPARTSTAALSLPDTAPGASADLAAASKPAAAPAQSPPGIVAAPAALTAEPAVPAERAARDALADAAPATAPAPPPPAVAAPAPPPPPPPPVAQALAAAEESNTAEDIVVTGSRISGRAAKARARLEQRVTSPGAWNACTVDDPRQDLAECRKTASIGDGLARAWRGDDDGAITAFDRAIAASPKSAPAWLNRGLARARAGDDARALTDLDKAVKYGPNDPRTWFHRSVILRRLGKTNRADADAARAAALDPRYEDLVE